jgi:aminopeptidase N
MGLSIGRRRLALFSGALAVACAVFCEGGAAGRSAAFAATYGFEAAQGSEAACECGVGASALAIDPLQYVAPSRNFSTKRISLNLDLNVAAQTIGGSVTHTLEVLREGATELRLNCVALTVDSVSIDGAPAKFDYPVPDYQQSAPNRNWIGDAPLGDENDGLVVYANAPLARGQQITLKIEYHGAPREGLYFITPEKGIPGSRPEVWSQGQGERNRYWIPCFDYPNEKASYEGVFRADPGMYVLSNGRLDSVKELPDGREEYRWLQDEPQVTYLIMVAAARYEIVRDEWRGKEVSYLVPPGTGEDCVRRNFGLTPDMLEYFSTATGIDYPWDKYAQVVVQDFIFGGMENTSATVLTSRCLYDERMLPDRDAVDLIAHELAHQWWGDMVTCREWNEMWLNEGFATYFEKLYRRHRFGEAEFVYSMDGAHRNVIEADARDPRPLVVDFFNRRDAQSSANVYVKGASVLDMLRRHLGDSVFFNAIQRYGTEMRHKTAGTPDLMRACREASGENTDWFFEQWVYLSGHPDLKVTKAWDAARGLLTLKVEQTQQVTDQVPLFRLPLEVEIACPEKTELYKIVVAQQSQEFYFKLPSAPLMVLFDKGGGTLMTLDFPRGVDELRYQLEHGDDWARIEAARALGALGPNDAAALALKEELRADGFWGLRRECALALAKGRAALAGDALLAGLDAGNSRVRTACAEALGDLPRSDAAETKLLALLGSDYSYHVQNAALNALVKLGSNQAYEECVAMLGRESCNSALRSNALDRLAQLDDARALDIVKRYAGPGNSRNYRHAALSAYAALSGKAGEDADSRRESRHQAARHLAPMLGDWYPNTRSAVIGALADLADKSMVDKLRLQAQSDPQQRLRKQAREAADKIAAHTDESAQLDEVLKQVKQLQDRLDALQKEVGDLKSRVPEQPVK